MESHKRSWFSTVLGGVERLVSRSRVRKTWPQTPAEISPLPDDRAFDREENIVFLKQNYPKREYQQSSKPAPQPNEDQQKIDKDEPLRGFHGG